MSAARDWQQGAPTRLPMSADLMVTWLAHALLSASELIALHQEHNEIMHPKSFVVLRLIQAAYRQADPSLLKWAVDPPEEPAAKTFSECASTLTGVSWQPTNRTAVHSAGTHNTSGVPQQTFTALAHDQQHHSGYGMQGTRRQWICSVHWAGC
jgi:hypothetical protein